MRCKCYGSDSCSGSETTTAVTLARDRGLKVNVLAETKKGDGFDPKHTRTDDRVVTIPLPSGDIAPLQTSKEELCVIAGHELVTEKWETSKTHHGHGVRV